MTMPAFYIPHGGGPCFFMDWMPPDTWNALGGWMRSIPATLPQQPRAQIVFSAHWEQSEFTLLRLRGPLACITITTTFRRIPMNCSGQRRQRRSFLTGCGSACGQRA